MESSKESTKFELKTFGCKVNTYDTGLLQERLKNELKISSDKKLHILNTCAVTAEATKEALRQIRRIKRKDPNSLVVVTGCAAQVDTKSFEEELGADLIVANSHKGKMGEILSSYLEGNPTERVHHSNIFKKDDLEAGGGLEEGHTRAFLKIQDGCNSFCTYCVIPYARGKSRSIPIPQLIERVNDLYQRGYREIVVTGIHIADYASERSATDDSRVVSAHGRRNIDRYYFLEDLLEAILKYTKMPRIRLSSIEPLELNARILALYSDERMCPHFHMSIQSANNKILRLMKRKYDAKAVEDSLNSISKHVKNAFVGMDVIVGFPGETEEDYLDSFQRLQNLDWTRIHVFPYSDRPGTKAMDLEGKLKEHIKVDRSRRLRELSTERYSQAAISQIGSLKKALALKNYQEKTIALSRDYWQIQLSGNIEMADIVGESSVKIIGFDNSSLSRMDGLLLGEWS